MKNKKRNFLLIWILALALLLNVLAFVPVVAQGGQDLNEVSGFNYTLEYAYVPKVVEDPVVINPNDEIDIDDVKDVDGWSVRVDFTIDNSVEFTNDDYLEIDLSGLVNIIDPEIFGDKRIPFDIPGESDPVDAAKFSIEAGPTLRIEFDHGTALNDKEGREGWVELSFSKKDNGEDAREDISVPTSKDGEKNFVVTRKYSGASAISKTVVPYESGTGKIVWIIDVNTKLDDLSGAYIIDTLPVGLTVTSVKKVELKVTTSDVSTKGDPQVISNEHYNFNEGARELRVNGLDLSHKAQRVIIETSFAEGGGKVEYKNEVELFDSSDESLGEDTATVTAGIEGISKGATSGDKPNVIKWTIEYVGDGTNNEITDVLTVKSTNDETLQFISIFFDKDSFEINGKDVESLIPEPSVESRIGGDVDGENKGKLIITFSNLPKENGEKYTITYNTESFYSGVSEVNDKKYYTVTNSAKYGDKGPAFKSEDFYKESIITKDAGLAYREYVDDEWVTYIDWKITINQNNEIWKNVNIIETIPKGFKFVKAVREGVEGTLNAGEPSDNEGNEVRTIAVVSGDDELSKETTIIVTTKLIADDLDPNEGETDGIIGTNKAHLEWDLGGSGSESGYGIGHGPGSSEDDPAHGTSDFEAHIYLSALNHKLSKKAVELVKNDDHTGEASWEIIYETFSNAVPGNFRIEDKIDESGGSPQKYVSDSFELTINGEAFDLTADGTEKTKGTGGDAFKYTLTITGDENKSVSFELKINPDVSTLFNNKTNRLELTYDTTVDFTAFADVDPNQNNILKNDAYVFFENEEKLDANAWQSYPKNFSRNGVKEGKTIKTGGVENTFSWTAKLNYKSKTVEGPIVEELQGGHKFITGSLVIYKAELNESYENDSYELVIVDGQDAELEVGTDYKVAFEPADNPTKTKMTITFFKNNEAVALDHPIIMTYQTEAVGIAQKTYENKITFNNITYSAKVQRTDHNKFLNKELLNGRGSNKDKVVLGDVLEWEIDVNENLSEIENFVLTDTLSDGLVLIPESVEVYKGDDKIAPVEDSTTEDGFVIETETGEFTLSKDLVNERYTVKYKTLVIKVDGVNNISNTVKIEGDEWQTSITSKDYDIVSASSAGGIGRDGDLELKVIKVDKDDNPIGSRAKFKLTIKTTIGGVTYTAEHPFTTDRNGEFVTKITPSELSDYFLEETEAPAGYILNDEPIQIDFDGKDIERRIQNKAILKVDLEAEKTLLGQALRENQFEFKLLEKTDGDYVDFKTAKNDANGKIVFEGIKFTEANTYWFKIVETEVEAITAFMDYDNAEYFAKVEVQDSGSELTASISYYKGGTEEENLLTEEGQVAEFTNTYKASGSFTAEFQKKLTGGGRNIENKEFTFVLTPVGDAPLRTSENGKLVEEEKVETTNDGAGNFSFTLFFNQDDLDPLPSKEFKYKISEVIPADPEKGMVYDTRVYNITVTVVDDRQGNLIVTAPYGAGEGTSGVLNENETPTFTNTYTASGTWSPTVTKQLFGRGLRNNEFEFEMTPVEDTPGVALPEGIEWPLKARNSGSGVSFGPITFNQDDIGKIFEFIISEVTPSPSEGGMRYDENEYKVVVEVKDAGNGQLDFTTTYSLNEETPGQEQEALTGITFRNIYSAGNAWTPNVTKELVGRELKDKEFEFVLKGPQGNVIEKVKNDADGNVVFSSIGFSEADIGGSYTYTIEEVVGSEPGMSYDTRSIKINVSISDAGGGVLNINASYPAVTTFVNRYSGPSGITVTANKVWKDLPSGWTTDLPTIWFKLYRSVEGKTAEAVPGLALQKLPAGVTQVSWNGLEKYDPDGKLYVYSVKEVDENGKDYEPKYFEKTENGLTVTNAFIKERVDGDEDFETEIDVTGHKVWKGVPKGQTVPTIWLKLYRHIEGGTPVAVAGRPIMELPPGVTQGTWKELEKVDENYNYYIYSVKEVDNKGKDYEPPHFRKTEEGLTVTNTHTAGAPVTGETLSVYTIMGAMLMALAALFLILTGRKRAKAK